METDVCKGNDGKKKVRNLGAKVYNVTDGALTMTQRGYIAGKKIKLR